MTDVANGVEREGGAGGGDADEVVVFPVSFAQQRLWFLDRLEPGSGMYNMPLVRRLAGALDVEAFRRALEEMIARHEALRTTFWMDGGEPVQVVHPARRLELPVVDFSHLPAEEREAAITARVQAESWAPFDLREGPVFRPLLLRAGPDDHVMILAMHHIVGDAWSLGVLGREVVALYGAFRKGLPSPLPELPIQYADYATWQREFLSGEELERQISFWSEHLRGAPAALELPTDRPRPAVQTYNGATRNTTLPAEATGALDRLGRLEGASRFMTLLSVFYAYLARWTGETDLVVGTPVAGREQQETEDLIGIFINSLALRARLDDDPSFRVLLRRVRGMLLDAYAHQELPFEKLVEELRVERSLSHAPVFQVMFSLTAAPTRQNGMPELEVRGVETPMETSKFDVSFGVMEGTDGVHLSVEYNTDLFDAATAERMGRHFALLCEAVAAAPDVPISRLSLLPAAERERVLGEWNDTARDYGRLPLVHQAVAEWARRTPDAVAVEQEGRRLTWAELDAQANRVARRLRALGVRGETRVGLCLERRPEMISALLGILRAGGAYVPLDPAYPAERLAYLLEDSGAAVLVTTSTLRDRLPEASAAALLLLDAHAEEIGRESPEALDAQVDPAQAAYAIYTSGSTGRPKGVLVTHANLSAYVRSAEELYQVVPADRVLQFASVSFDISVEEIFVPLFTGATMVLRTDAMIASPAGFLRLAAEWELSVVSLPTTFWHAVAAEVASLRVPPSLRLVIIGGERALPERAAAWLAAVGGRVALANSYGPTETTVSSTAAFLPADAGADGRELPIGRPFPNQRAYVLDEAGQPSPVGVPGELYIGGAGVARGYLNRPAMTAEKFVPDPFAGVPGARMYRTGDRARWREDGQLEFLRRRDDQVKVRGFRVEPGEVEAVLREQPGVREAVVMAREDMVPGEKRLAAYLVAEPGAALEVAGLRAAVRERLPDYMVPSALVLLPELPLTPNGKVDRRALPAPASVGEGEGGAPRQALDGQVEETVAAVWREVLGLSEVGAGDNFFDLGGHSILLARVQGRLREELGRDVGLVTLFRYPTVRALAEALTVADEADGGDTARRGRERADSRRDARARRRDARAGS